MIHGVAALVAYASRLITLERGDLLFTGTPAGVGPLTPGDEAVAEIEKVGTLTVRVEAGP
jgi:2-keto-4-pentenoate hydratase/2-oxohepta-3-ene-1,7-dioic acid hydratase in catechol pathway